MPTSSCALAGLTPEECLFQNHPLLRKYYQANLHRDKIGAIVSLLPREDLTITLNTNWWNDNYYDSELGMTERRAPEPRCGHRVPAERWVSTYSFYNYERTVSDSAGWEFSNVQQALDPTRRWWSDETVHTHTAGAGFNLAIIQDRLGIGVDYLFAQSSGAIDTVRNPGSTLAAPVPFPDLLERQHNVSVHADYHFTDQTSRCGWAISSSTSTRTTGRYDDLSPTSLTCSGTACVIGTGQESPHYTANVVSWSLVYTFW